MLVAVFDFSMLVLMEQVPYMTYSNFLLYMLYAGAVQVPGRAAYCIFKYIYGIV